jgi:hypothetical protein
LDLELHTNEDAQIAKRLVIVAIWCIQRYPFTRPSMKEVIRMLEGASESLLRHHCQVKFTFSSKISNVLLNVRNSAIIFFAGGQNDPVKLVCKCFHFSLY